MSVLSDIIARWHAAHPEFPLTPSPSSVGSSAADNTAVADHVGPASVAASCVQTHGVTGAVLFTRVRSQEARRRQAATRIGVRFDEYDQHAENGERWCSGHRDWHLRGRFAPRSGSTYCREWQNAYRARRDARRAAS